MDMPRKASSGRSSRVARRFAVAFLLAAVGCTDTGSPADDAVDSSTSSVTPYDASSVFPGYDAGTTTPFPTYDAGGFPGLTDASVDSGAHTASDAGDAGDAGSTLSDAGNATSDASATADGGFSIPDLFPDAGAPKDAGTTTKSDGGRDVHGPCKDLNLICFDGFDMFLNAECQTCNSGKGCAGCALPFAF